MADRPRLTADGKENALEPGLEIGARQILAARAATRRLESLPEEQRPRTLADAYRVQQAVTVCWGDAVAGWKVGATSKQVQELFGIAEPVFGPVFERTVFRSPAHLGAADFQHLMLEAEFAFRFGRDLPARAAPCSREEVLAAVEAVVPAFEIVSPRLERLAVDDIPLLVADFCANGGAVLGTPFEDWRRLDLPRHTITLFIGGVQRQEGTGALVLGDPLNVLEWLVSDLGSRGLGIKAGQFVMTGTMTGIHAPEPGQTAVADFDGLGSVEVVFE